MSEFNGFSENNKEQTWESKLFSCNKQFKIKDILKSLDNISLFSNKKIKVCGWIRTVRSSGNGFSFCSLNDGSTPDCLQIIVQKDNDEDNTFDDFYENATTGCALRVEGHLIESPAKGQFVELVASNIFLEGKVQDSNTYPIAKTKINLDTLRQICHLRPRTGIFGSIFRIRSMLTQATHQFYGSKGFLHLDPNVISINECEGGAGVFTVTELDHNQDKKADWKEDHFGKRAFLTVSSQLQLEALACAMGSVYTTNKSFRSEHSLTSKHVSEFTHLEIEQCFTDFKDLMDVGEEYIKFVIEYVIQNGIKDLLNLAKVGTPDLVERLNMIYQSTFHRMTYHQAIQEIQDDLKNKVIKMKVRPKVGDDLGTEHENYLTQKYGKPVFVTHWPLEIKSFYMKQCSNGTCESFDLLMPYGVGELIGASQREDDYQKLIDIMEKKGIDRAPLEFYLDLRKYGTCQHGGFGLGMDRFLMLLTGMSSIKDVIPFPVYYTSCNY